MRNFLLLLMTVLGSGCATMTSDVHHFSTRRIGDSLTLLTSSSQIIVTNPDGKLVPEEIAMLQEQLQDAHPVFGDRRCELTVIGPESDRAVFVPELHECFCTDEEIAHWRSGGTFVDPWPKSLLRV